MKKLILSIATLLIILSCNKTSTSNSNNNPKGIEGIWMVYRSNFPNTTMDFYEMVFYPNGISSEWVPRIGLYNYDPNSEPDKNSGVYTFNGKSGINKTGPQSQYEDELNLETDNTLKIGGYVYHRCANVDGKKLNASYTSYGDPHDPTLLTLPYGQKPVITFNADGTFLDEGLFNTAFVLDPQPAPGSGTYEIKNFSIIMKYADNRVRQCSIHGIFSKDILECDKIFLEGLDINKM
jgi:hypothetical protein